MKYVLVTGASGGMGKATVKRLLSEGYGVFALDLGGYPEEEGIVSITADVTKEESLLAAKEKILSYTKELYAIVHFAGVYMLDSLIEIERERFERAFRINLFGAFLVNRIMLSLLTKGSRILITTSELAPLSPLPFTGLYAVTKSALDKYAYALRMELQLIGITVSVLRAGAVDTGMLGASTDALDRFCENTTHYACNAERFKRIVERVEARKISPEKLAKRVSRVLGAKKPRFAYAINRNPLLLLAEALPLRLRFFAIRQLLKKKDD